MNRIPVFKTSLVISLSIILFTIFFVSPEYKSESVLDVSLDANESFSSNFASSILPSSGSSDAFQVKLYLESYELSKLFSSLYDVDSYYKNSDISYFSKLKETRFTSFHEYFNKKFNILIDNDSNAIILQTFAFKPEDAKKINLQLINLTSNFFNKKSRLASLNKRSSKFCELYFTNAGMLNIDSSIDSIDINFLAIDGVSSANELLASKARKFQDFCIKEFNTNKNIKNAGLIIPDYELKNINADATKKIISDIYSNSMDAVTEVDYMEIIVEPVVSSTPESKRIIILSILAFVITTVVLLTIKIILRLSNEFKT